MKNIILAVLISGFLVSCSRDMDSATYTDTSTAGVVLEGVIVSKRAVKIRNNEKDQPNAGTLAGGALGGVGANSIGKGTGKGAATIGGAIAGALIGTALQNEFSTQNGIEYIVKVRDGEASKTTYKKKTNMTITENPKIQNQLTSSIDTDNATKLISVVQGTTEQLNVGQKVYVIFSDDRPRVIARDAFEI